MKKLFTLFSVLCLGTITFGQANEQGNIHIDLGGGAGFYNASYTFEFNGDSETGSNNTGVSAYINLTAEYSIQDWLSVGLNYKRGLFVIEDSFNEKNAFNNIGLQARAYFLNTDQFGMFGSVAFGGTFLNQQETYDAGNSGNSQTYTYKWSGTDLGLGMGFKWYVKDHIGMHLIYDFNVYNVKFVYQEVDGNELGIPSGYDYKQKANGHEVRMGVSFKI